jgi:hypothetical protein
MAGLSWHHLRVIRRTPLINQHNLALIPMHKARNGGKKAAKLVFLFSCMQLLLGQKKVVMSSLALCNMHMVCNGGVKLCKTLFGPPILSSVIAITTLSCLFQTGYVNKEASKANSNNTS